MSRLRNWNSKTSDARAKPRTPLWILLGAIGIGVMGAGIAGFSVANSKRHDGAEMAPTNLANFPVCLSDATWAVTEFSTEMSQANKRMHHAMNEVTPTGNPDRDFMRAMIPHHQGAIDMARALLKFGDDERVKRLAHAVITEQAREVAYMRMLLDQPTTTGSHNE